jgi:hypothetical protein
MAKKSVRKAAQSEKSRQVLSNSAKTDYPVQSWPKQGSKKLAALQKKKTSDLTAYELFLRSDYLPKLCTKYNATVRHAESEERRAEVERTVRKAAKKVLIDYFQCGSCIR